MTMEGLLNMPGGGGGGGMSRPPVQLIKPREGIVLKTFDKKTGKKVFINLVCHELVKRPLDAMDKEVDDEQLDKFGIRNLRVPLDVGDPKPSTDKSGEPATKCDVIFNPCVVERASKPGPMQEYFIAELASLSLGWVAKEMQTVLDPKFKVIKGKYHGDGGPESFPWVDGAWDPWGNKAPEKKKTKNTGASEGEAGSFGSKGGQSVSINEVDGIAVGEKMSDDEMRPVSTKKVGAAKPVVQKGFLNSAKNAGKLYENEDGTHGSREQSGPFYDPAEEQLKHLPEGLRKKCAVVDTTKMTPEETRDAMEQYAQSGRVTSGPAAVGGPARKPSEREKKEFDEMLRKMSVKADAYNGADEPSFALKLDKKKSKASSLTEFEHECTKIAFPALGCDAYSLVVTMPDEIEDMGSVEVEVSALKAEVQSTVSNRALNLAWPSEINADIAKAKFSKKKRTLTITAPII